MNEQQRRPAWHNFVAGISASSFQVFQPNCDAASGACSTLVLHPVDVIKTRMQVQGSESVSGPRFTNSWQIAQHLVRNEGWRSLYKGVSPNLAGNAASWGLYFFGFRIVTDQLHHMHQLSKTTSDLVSGVVTGTLVLAVTNPIWVVKTRQCLDMTSDRPNVSLLGSLRDLWKNEGLRGFYRGFGAGLFGTTHGALQFTSYQYMRRHLIDGQDSVPWWQTTLIAGASKIFAATATYPYQVVRSRLQRVDSPYTGLIDCIQRTFRNEGFSGFYRGVIINVLKVTPAACVVFVTYESVIESLGKLEDRRTKD